MSQMKVTSASYGRPVAWSQVNLKGCNYTCQHGFVEIGFRVIRFIPPLHQIAETCTEVSNESKDC